MNTTHLFDIFLVKYEESEHKLYSDIYAGGFDSWNEAAGIAQSASQELRLAPNSETRFEVRPCDHKSFRRKHGKVSVTPKP